MNETIILKKSAEIDLNDSFFKSLKETILNFRLGSIRNQKMGVERMAFLIFPFKLFCSSKTLLYLCRRETVSNDISK